MLVSNSLVFQGWPWNCNPPAGILNTGITDQASFHYYLKDSALRTNNVILRKVISLIKGINITALLNLKKKNTNTQQPNEGKIFRHASNVRSNSRKKF